MQYSFNPDEAQQAHKNLAKSCRRSIKGKEKEPVRLFLLQSLESSYDSLNKSLDSSKTIPERLAHTEIGRKENIEAWKYAGAVSSQNSKVRLPETLPSEFLENSKTFAGIKIELTNKGTVNAVPSTKQLVHPATKFFAEVSKLRIAMIIVFVICIAWTIFALSQGSQGIL